MMEQTTPIKLEHDSEGEQYVEWSQWTAQSGPSISPGAAALNAIPRPIEPRYYSQTFPGPHIASSPGGSAWGYGGAHYTAWDEYGYAHAFRAHHYQAAEFQDHQDPQSDWAIVYPPVTHFVDPRETLDPRLPAIQSSPPPMSTMPPISTIPTARKHGSVNSQRGNLRGRISKLRTHRVSSRQGSSMGLASPEVNIDHNDNVTESDSSYTPSDTVLTDTDDVEDDQPMSETAMPPIIHELPAVIPSHLITPELEDTSISQKIALDIQVRILNVFRTRSTHLRILRALQTLCIPGIPVTNVLALLDAAMIRPSELVPGPYQGLGLTLPFRTISNPARVHLIMHPHLSHVPELLTSFHWQSEFDGTLSESERSAQHRTRATSSASAWDPHEVCYPLGFLPFGEWRIFEGEFGPNYQEHIFSAATFVHPPSFPALTNRADGAVEGPLVDPEVSTDGFLELNRYDPLYIRVHPKRGRESFCGSCQMWQKRDKSNWLHHMKSIHGIRSSTGMSYPLPLLVARRPDRDFRTHRTYVAYCDECRSWQNLNNPSGKAPLSSWFLHLAQHDVTRNRESHGAGRKRSKKNVADLQYQVERFNFESRRHTLIDIQRLVQDELRVNGDIGQFSGPVFASAINIQVFDVPE